MCEFQVLYKLVGDVMAMIDQLLTIPCKSMLKRLASREPSALANLSYEVVLDVSDVFLKWSDTICGCREEFTCM